MRAFVLKTVDYKESHKLVYFYTHEGLKSAIAYQTKKMTSRSRYLLQPLTQVDVSFSTGKLPAVKEVELINDYTKIKEELVPYTYSLHILELIYGTVHEEDDHEKMCSFLHRLFLLMDEQNTSVLTMVFELKLLHFIGYGLQFKRCGVCGKTEDVFFHPSSGGVVCLSHISATQQVASKEETTMLKTLYYLDINEDTLPIIERSTIVKLRFLINLLYEEFVSYQTKSSKILHQIEKIT